MSASAIKPSIFSLLESSLNCAYIELPSNNLISPLSSALKSILPAASSVISPEDRAMVVPSILKLSTSIPASAVRTPVTPTVEAKVAAAFAKVIAVVVPDLMIKLLPVEVSLPYCAPPSSRAISPPSASSMMSSAASIIKSSVAVIVSPLIVSSSMSNSVAVTLLLKVAAPASDISRVRAVMVDSSSSPLNLISLLFTEEAIIKSELLFVNLPN